MPVKDNSLDIAQAVRDTVTVRGQTDYVPKRSMTAQQSPSQQSPKHPQRRSHSQESAHRDKSSKSKSSKGKKGSQHADVIDRLDFTGVGPMFHHDGPFDACAPSRNRQRNKAPMFAWSGRSEDLLGSSSAYPSPDAYKAFSNTNYVDPPKKKVDAIAEAWGIHEPEPYEEFFAGGGTGRADGDTPASSIYNGRDAHRPSTQRRAKDTNIDQSPSADPARRPIKRAVPPPQPIFAADNSDLADTSGTSPPLSPGGNTQRKKSLMHRIRKMRDAPNVPVSSDYDTPPSPSSVSDGYATRPTHRSQNSFLGRFGGRTGQSAPDKPEPFIYIEQSNKDVKDVNKELPPPPIGGAGESPPDGAYLDGVNPGGAAIGRKTSLMKKVGRVVGRNRQ